MNFLQWTMVGILFVAPAGVEATESEKITAVETGLRPEVVFQGDEAWSLQERMEHYGVPGVGIAVIHDYQVVWFKTYGLADRETGEEAGPATLFQAGSISKPVAALGALMMVGDGRLSLDGDVNDVLQSWALPDNEFTANEKVTLTRLLSHTGGLTVHGFPGYAVGETVPGLVQVLDGTGPANTDAIRVDKTPGAGWRYSGGGYTIVQQMMIDAGGKPFPALMKGLVLEPLNMTHSTFLQPLPPDLLGHAAAGVFPDGSSVPGKRHTYPEMAAAGLWTTAEDLAIFAAEVQRALKGESQVVSRETAEAMVEPVVENYGRGWGLWHREGAPYFGHGGWDEGFCAQLTAHRDDGYGVAAMINSNHPSFLSELVRAVAYTYEWEGYEIYRELDVPELALATFGGRYRYNAEQSLLIFREQDRLFLRYVGKSPEELLYVGEDRYMRRERATPVTFTNEEGEVQMHFILDEGGFQTHSRLADDEILPREILAGGDYAAALAAYRDILKADPEEPAVSERYLNSQGLSCLEHDAEHAIAVLRVTADLYPESANTWDSLGYAYLETGDKQQAIKYYRLALVRDPEFSSARQALAELEGN